MSWRPTGLTSPTLMLHCPFTFSWEAGCDPGTERLGDSRAGVGGASPWEVRTLPQTSPGPRGLSPGPATWPSAAGSAPPIPAPV